MTTRQLLLEAAKALDAGDDPFSAHWLGEHDVTFDQCMTLAEQLAIGARMVATAIRFPQSEIGRAYFETIAVASLTETRLLAARWQESHG